MNVPQLAAYVLDGLLLWALVALWRPRSRLTPAQWCLRHLGVAVDRRGIWWNRRSGSTRLWPW